MADEPETPNPEADEKEKKQQQEAKPGKLELNKETVKDLKQPEAANRAARRPSPTDDDVCP